MKWHKTEKTKPVDNHVIVGYWLDKCRGYGHKVKECVFDNGKWFHNAIVIVTDATTLDDHAICPPDFWTNDFNEEEILRSANEMA